MRHSPVSIIRYDKIITGNPYSKIDRAENYCRTSDNVRLNLANVRAKVILIVTLYIFFAVTKSDCKFTQFAFCNKIYEAF